MTLDADAPMVQQPKTPETETAERDWHEHWNIGPRRGRWTELPVQRGDPAPSVDLVEARSGRLTSLAEMWADGPALLLFWRHFGCSCGRDRAERLRDEYMAYRAAGARVALVGQGERERSVTYASANGLPEDMPLLRDPDEVAYRAYWAARGWADRGPLRRTRRVPALRA